MPQPKFKFSAPTASDTDAPLALSLLRQHDYGSSLMDRAQRQRRASDEFGARAQALREQAATTTLPQEAQLAALDRQSQQLADAERTQTGYRRLRERFDPDELDRSLQQIGAIADPVQQRESLTQLQGSYAGFAFNPELARRMDAQFAAFEPVVQRREGARLLAAIKTGRYAPTLADARQIYPGRKINTMMAPGSKTPFFVPERFADPDLEAEAVQVIQNAYHLAQVTGKHAYLEAALDDEAVRQVSRIPGNRASAVFGQALEALSATAPERQLNSPAPATARSASVSSEAPPATQSIEGETLPIGGIPQGTRENGEEPADQPFELPLTWAEQRRRYGEIRPASATVGPPIPLTAKNIAAVAADAVAKTVVGMATIGNFADQPRGNLHEIGAGFSIGRTAAGEMIGVDVDNPRFGVASDLLPFAAAIAAKPRGGQTKIHGDTVTVYRVEGVENTRMVIDGEGRVHILDEKGMLWVNVGQKRRALQYLRQKLEGKTARQKQGEKLGEPHIKSFEVSQKFLDEMRATAVHLDEVSKFPDRPQKGDRRQARDQYGLRPEQVEALERAIIQGTGKVDGVGMGVDALSSGLGNGGLALPLTLKRDETAPNQGAGKR